MEATKEKGEKEIMCKRRTRPEVRKKKHTQKEKNTPAHFSFQKAPQTMRPWRRKCGTPVMHPKTKPLVFIPMSELAASERERLQKVFGVIYPVQMTS